MSESGLLCAGDLYVDLLTTTGARTGLVKAGNTTRLEITEPAEDIQRISRKRESRGQILSDVSIKQPSTLGITIDTITRQNLAIALLGVDETVAVVAGSVTSENVTAYMGKASKLAFANLDSGTPPVVQDVTDVTTYVENTDYTVDYRLGLITPTVGGAITEADVLHVDYTYKATDGYRIKGGAEPQINAYLFLDGKNLDNGDHVHVTVDSAKLRPDSPVDFFAEAFVELGLTGSMSLLDGKDSPYTVDIITPAA